MDNNDIMTRRKPNNNTAELDNTYVCILTKRKHRNTKWDDYLVSTDMSYEWHDCE